MAQCGPPSRRAFDILADVAKTETDHPTRRTLAEAIASRNELSDRDLRRLRRHFANDGKANVVDVLHAAQALRAEWVALTAVGQVDIDDAVEAGPPELGPADAVVRRLSDDTIVVLGNRALGHQFGTPVHDLTPELTRTFASGMGKAFAATNAGLNAVSAVQGLQQTGTVFKVTKEYLPLLRQFDLATSEGQRPGHPARAGR
jgi:hypothetical protein